MTEQYPKPCSHCGGYPKIQEIPGTTMVVFSIYCMSCGLTTLPRLTLREALMIWNRRAAAEEVVND